MRCFVPKEADPGETRAALVPETAARLVSLGIELKVEKGLGAALRVPDKEYTDQGATVVADRGPALAEADLVLRLGPPPEADIAGMARKTVHISFLSPFLKPDLVRALAARDVTAIAMELIPRTTLAQKMDAVSSQASLGGYVAVMLAANRLNKVFPMMMTPAGTLAPARVFVIGAGVAGLQAIATARRLGARVEAFDTRPAVEEQVHSLGARFVKVDLGETGETRDGYARALTEQQLQQQRDALGRSCAAADVVVSAAQVFGKKAPVIVTRDMLASMRPGSVVVDMAVETGGNVEGVEPDSASDVNGVHVLGYTQLPRRVPAHASQMFSSNIVNLVEHFWNKDTAGLDLRQDDPILQGCLAAHGGRIVHETLQDLTS